MHAPLLAKLPVSIVYRRGAKSKVCAAMSTHVGPQAIVLSLYDTPERGVFGGKTFVLRITLPDLLDTVELSARLHTAQTLPKELHIVLLHGHQTQTRWSEFLSTIARAPQDPQAFVRHKTHVTALTITFESVEAFLDFAQIDIHLGGIFLPTDRILPINSLVVLKLTHPLSQEHCTLDTRVSRQVSGVQPGLSLRFCHDVHVIVHKLKPLLHPEKHAQPEPFARSKDSGTWPFSPHTLHPQGP